MRIAEAMRKEKVNWRMEYDLPRPNSQNPSNTTTTRVKPKRNGRPTAHDQTAVHTNGTTNNDFERSEADGNS
jgi:hypothetical protein